MTVLTAAFGHLRGTTTQDGYTVVRVPSLRRRADRSNPIEMLAFLLSGLARALRLGREVAFDGAIAFFTIPSGPIAWMLQHAIGVPYIVSLRGGDVPGIVPELARVHRVIAPLRRRVLRAARAVVANSPSLARLSETADRVPVDVIPNGVDHAIFAPCERDAACGSSESRELRVLFVGRLVQQKNVDALLHSVAALRTLPGPPIALEIVGDGPERPRLEALARTTGAAPCVRWRGWLDKQGVAASMRHSHVFVNPSWYEGMPNTVLEAMAAALPVIASRIGGNDDLVAEGATGLLFDLESPEQLTLALQQLRSDSKLRATLGARARQRVVEAFGWSSVARHYASLLNRAGDA